MFMFLMCMKHLFMVDLCQFAISLCFFVAILCLFVVVLQLLLHLITVHFTK